MPVSASTRIFAAVVFLVFVVTPNLKSNSNRAFAAAEHGALIRVANMYLSPDPNSAKLAEIERGRELVVIESTRGDWVHVEAFLGEEKTVTGWILDKGFIRNTTQDGDRILFGEGADSEDEASRRHGRRAGDK